MTASADQNKELFAKINRETSRMPWSELLRYFASGIIIEVSDKLDLIEVAVAISRDDKEAVKEWMFHNQLVKVSDDRALAWLKQDASLWTVVIKPWILVQEKELPNKGIAAKSSEK